MPGAPDRKSCPKGQLFILILWSFFDKFSVNPEEPTSIPADKLASLLLRVCQQFLFLVTNTIKLAKS